MFESDDGSRQIDKGEGTQSARTGNDTGAQQFGEMSKLTSVLLRGEGRVGQF